MRKQLRIAKTTRSIGHSLLAVAVASCICMPLTATAAETDTPLTATEGNDSSDAPIAVTLERTNEAPAATEEFFIEDDGTALTWDEFCAKYYNEDEEADDSEEEDNLAEYEDWAEDEDGEADLEDNGWFLDTDDFRWYYYAEDADAEYADGSIPAKYAAAALADGLAFGKLHDPDFGGTWYFSEAGACWHLIDAQDRDHAKPSPELLKDLYEKYADADEEEGDGSTVEGEGETEEDEALDDGEDEEGDEDSIWDEERWEQRVVGYGFSMGDTVTLRATIANTGAAALSLDLATAFDGTATDPAVYGFYPLDGSGTHPATDPAPTEDEADDEGESVATDGKIATQEGESVENDEAASESGKTGAEDESADEGSDADGEGEAESADAKPLFGNPVFTAVSGEGVTWDNEAESKDSEVAPHITIPAGATATVEYSVEVTGATERVLAADATDDAHGYAHTASSHDAKAAETENLATAEGEADGDASETATIADQSATTYIPTDYSRVISYADATAVAKAGSVGARSIGTKAWKRSKSEKAPAAAAPKATAKSTPAKTGDALPPMQALALLAAVSLAVAALSATRMRQGR